MKAPLPGIALALCASGCGSLPSELNLAPFYRHRLADDRSLLELDVAWPLIHYERTAQGGDDLRIRPFWRRIVEGDRTEHQFLWPFGRVVSDHEEIDARLFPLWTWRWRLNGQDQRESEWEAPYPVPILPFIMTPCRRWPASTLRRLILPRRKKSLNQLITQQTSQILIRAPQRRRPPRFCALT